MKKIIILSLTFLAVFVLLIFKSSFCWASTDFQIDFSVMNHDLLITLDNSNGDFDNYKYCIIASDGENYQFLLSTSSFYIDNSGVNTAYYIGFRNTDNSNILVSAGFGSDTSLYTYQFDNLGVDTRPSVYNNIIFSNSIVYIDSTLEEQSNINVYHDLYEYGESLDFQGVVNKLANDLSVDTLFIQVQNSVPIIVIAVTFVLGFILVRMLLKRSSKGSL